VEAGFLLDDGMQERDLDLIGFGRGFNEWGGNGIGDGRARRRRPGNGGFVRPGKQPGAGGLGLLVHGGALLLEGGAHQLSGGDWRGDGGAWGQGRLGGRLSHGDAGYQDTNPLCLLHLQG
jgi:hypothetical protein